MFDFIKIKRNRYFLLFILLFFCIGFLFGTLNNKDINLVFENKTKEEKHDVDLKSFWKVWEEIDKKYPKSEEINKEKRMHGATKGLISSLDDPYSVYLNPEETKIFKEEIINGSFSGLGVEIGIKDKILTVIAPLKDTPAYKAGLKSGDKIIQIDEKITSDMSIDEAVKLMRGERGTSVKLTIYREEENRPRDITIIRDIINIPTLETELRDDKIFVIKLFSFGQNSKKLFKEAIIEFSKAKTDKLLLDLRGNPGGYLESSIDMASYFLPKGKPVLIEDYGENKKEKVFRSYGYDVFNDNLKLIVLIDGGSASASEILAGALRDHKKAKIVGMESYGKGSVQEVVDITKDTILKITVAKWLTPDGTSISNKGLIPDYIVPLFEKKEKKEGDNEEDIKIDKDKEKQDMQMQKAVELLLNWTKIK